MDNWLDYCPKKNRLYIVTFISLILTSTIIASTVFMANNIKGLNQVEFQFKDKEGNTVKPAYYHGSIGVSIISLLYTCYILYILLTGETWEISKIASYIDYRYITEGGKDVNPYQYKSYTESVPCYERKSSNGIYSESACVAEPNIKGCYWDDRTSTCKTSYTGGYSNFFVFLLVSIYLLVFGVMIQNDQDEIETSDEFRTLSTVAIIFGVIGILFSFADLVVC